MVILFRIFSFIKYFFIAGNEHRLHSPFLFQLYLNVVKNKKINANKKAESFRKALLSNHQSIEEIDFGTGDKQNQQISKIAKTSLKSFKEYLFLANLSNFLNPQNILELGTCFGLSTSYLKEGAPKAQITTLEGNPNRLNIAMGLLSQYKDIHPIEGNIDLTLEKALQAKPELIYIDANHTQKATLHYYELIKNNCAQNYCIVFDDIYYNQDMNEAWKTIKKDQNEAVTLDFYHFGLVFFRKEMLKQHFVLRF